MKSQLKWLPLHNNVEGEPRYLIYYGYFLTENEKIFLPFPDRYELALFRASKVGGKRFQTSSEYAGGIIFSTNNIEETENAILSLIKSLQL